MNLGTPAAASVLPEGAALPGTARTWKLEARPQAAHPDRVNTDTADRALNEQELEASRNVVNQSKHVTLQLLPNHHLGEDGCLRGFVMHSSAQDTANVLPLTADLFKCTCVYEMCASKSETVFDPDALRLVSDAEKTRATLRACMQSIQESSLEPATFDCIPETQRLHSSFALTNASDTRAWAESVPSKVGIYHAYVRTTSKDKREHKLFVVVTGALRHAAEELLSLWQDTSSQISCQDFLESEEVQWLRSATVRNNSRVAARVARALGLRCFPVVDPHAVGETVHMLMPSSVTMHHDLQAATAGRVRMVNAGCFPDCTSNGVALDMFSSEGVWIFCGPPDHQMYNSFGAQFAATQLGTGFPTSTVLFGQHYPPAERTNVVRSQGCDYLFPGEEFLRTVQRMGFNRNHGVLNLMPIAVLQCH